MIAADVPSFAGPSVNWFALSPMLVMLGAAMVLLVLGALAPRWPRHLYALFTAAAGLASTILHESGFRHDYIELQLAHEERDETSASYNHALYLKERRAMMQAWADMLEAMANDEGKVIQLRSNAASTTRA